ncbi:MAG: hypothetical protein H0U15_12100 [Geodermatophilaceae bacterium]|nr:hypothetical protein [Geodermatophilaceae bacterium]
MSGDGAARLAPLGYATPMLSTLLLLATGATATTSTLTGIGLVLICSLGVLALDRRTHPLRRRPHHAQPTPRPAPACARPR